MGNSYALQQSGEKHYMRGGKPGVYPSFNKGGIPHPVPFELFDPFGLSKNASPEKKERGLLAEINNGRLAMLGIMAFVSEAKVPDPCQRSRGSSRRTPATRWDPSPPRMRRPCPM